jgi:hypothetical protein
MKIAFIGSHGVGKTTAQAWILHTQIAQEIATEAQNEIVICDRSVLDNYAARTHGARRVDRCGIGRKRSAVAPAPDRPFSRPRRGRELTAILEHMS